MITPNKQADVSLIFELTQPRLDGLGGYHPDPLMVVAAQRIEALLVMRDELLMALAAYGKHKPGCASGWRAETGSSQIGPCDCGLGDAIAKGRG